MIRSVDWVVGGKGADEIRGNSRLNVLRGGPGPDRLYGLAGDDTLKGGRGRDRLEGDGGGDWIEGNTGPDTVIGASGADVLDGGHGLDRLRGGVGHDGLRSGTAFCGDGIDVVTPAANDYIHRDCERAAFPLPTRHADSKSVEPDPHPIRQDGASLTFRVPCPYTETDGYPDPEALTGTVRLSTPAGQLLGSGRIPSAGLACASADFAEDSSLLPRVRIRVPLNQAGIRVLAGSRARRVVVSYSGRNAPPVPWTIQLRRSRAPNQCRHARAALEADDIIGRLDALAGLSCLPEQVAGGAMPVPPRRAVTTHRR